MNKRLTTAECIKLSIWATAKKDWIENLENPPSLPEMVKVLNEDTGINSTEASLRVILKELGINPIDRTKLGSNRFITGLRFAVRLNEKLDILFASLPYALPPEVQERVQRLNAEINTILTPPSSDA